MPPASSHEPVARVPANFFGFEYVEGGRRRRDPLVVRGNGTLELYDDRLVFRRLVPSTTYVVPVDDIVTTEVGHAHNGKFAWPGRVLKVAYRDGERTVILGLLVRKRDAEAWSRSLRRLTR